MTYQDIFPVGAIVTMHGNAPLTVSGYANDLPGVVLVRDGEPVMTVNPRWLVRLATDVRSRASA